MTAQELERFKIMEVSVAKIQDDVAEIKSALLGNPLSGDKGLTGRINVLTAKMEILEARVLTLQEEKTKNTVYVKLINWLLAVVGVALISWIFSLLKK